MRFQQSFALVAPLLAASVYGAGNSSAAYDPDDSIRHQYNIGRNLSVGWIVFDGYAQLDVWGPMAIISSLSGLYNMSLVTISREKGLVGNVLKHTMPDGTEMDMSNVFNPKMEATHTPADAPPLDLLMIPGGENYLSTNPLDNDWIEAFIRERFNSTDYVASVCTGAVSLARAGVLEGKRATTNKWAWADVVKQGPNVEWVPNARWVNDSNGKLWTSSGVAAGMDMMYALMRWMYGDEQVNTIMNVIELSPHTDAHWDPYAVVHNVPGANKSRSLFDLVGPAGYATSNATMLLI